MKRTIIGMLLSVMLLVLFGCGGDCTYIPLSPTPSPTPTPEPTPVVNSVIMESFETMFVEGDTFVHLVPTQGVYIENPLTIRATVQRDGALVPDGTPVTFTVPAGEGTLSSVPTGSPAKAVAAPVDATTLTVPTAGGSASVIFRPNFTGITTVTASTTNYGSGQIKIDCNAGLFLPSSLAFVPYTPVYAVKGTTVNLKTVLNSQHWDPPNPNANKVITFTTTGGTLNPSTPVSTDANGEAAVTLTNATTGVFKVTAKLDDVHITSTYVSFVTSLTDPVAVFPIAAAPATLAKGSSSVITAHVVDHNGTAVNNVKVSFTTTGGTLSAATAQTDANGDAKVNLTSAAAGTFIVTARLADFPFAIGSSVQVLFTDK